jgi:hypothetical protein
MSGTTARGYVATGVARHRQDAGRQIRQSFLTPGSPSVTFAASRYVVNGPCHFPLSARVPVLAPWPWLQKWQSPMCNRLWGPWARQFSYTQNSDMRARYRRRPTLSMDHQISASATDSDSSSVM